MTRRVFISFLGTSNYTKCKYNINGNISEPVQFVQEALVKHYCTNWTDQDRVFIFCTSQAKEKNWDAAGDKGLRCRLAALNLPVPVEEVDIKAGFSEDEIWEIFDTVYSQLEPDDEIYFDVTHAFRSIPIFSIVLFNYSKFMKGTRLVTIHYGAFEASKEEASKEEASKVKVAPVIDLTNIARLQEYNQIASDLKDFGKVKRLIDVIGDGQDMEADEAVNQLGRSISELEEYIAVVELNKIRAGTFISNFRTNLENVQNISPIQNIFEEIKKETQDFVETRNYKNIEAAINWTIKHDMLMQTYPLAEEYIILRVKEELEEKLNCNKIFKKSVSSLLGMDDETFTNESRWDKSKLSNLDVARKIAGSERVRNLRPFYYPVTRLRNMLAHADSANNARSKYEELRNGICSLIECLTILNPDYEGYDSTQYISEFHYNDLINKILNRQGSIRINDYENIEAAINWTIKHGMPKQTYQLAKEYIILRVKEELKKGKSLKIPDYWFKKYVAALLGMNNDIFNNEKLWDKNFFRNLDVARKIAGSKLVRNLRPFYYPVTCLCNNMPTQAGDCVADNAQRDGIGNLIKCLTILNPRYKEYPSTKDIIKHHIELQ